MIDKEIIFSKYDMSNLTDEDKGTIIREFSELVGFQCLDLFMALGLETHMEIMLKNEANNKEYVFSFKTLERFIQDSKKITHDCSELKS